MKIEEKLPSKFHLTTNFGVSSASKLNLDVQEEYLESESGTYDKIKLRPLPLSPEVSTHIEIAAKKTVEVNVVAKSLDNVELPYRALMVITGDADQLLSDHSGGKRGRMPNDLVMAALRKAGVNMKKVQVMGDKIIMVIRGVLKGSFLIEWGVLP